MREEIDDEYYIILCEDGGVEGEKTNRREDVCAVCARIRMFG